MDIPKHYGSTTLMDYLISHNIMFAEGNVIKYVARWKEKDGLKDLRKAADYLHALIAHEELKQMGYSGDIVYPTTLQATNPQED